MARIGPSNKLGLLILYLVCGIFGLAFADDQTTTAVPATTLEPPVTWFECPDQYSYHPHPQNCTEYLICVFGKPYLRACAGGLNWNDMLKICDWPNAKTNCQQIDDNTAYRPMNSPTVTEPPVQSDQTSNPYGGFESSGLQNFKPDEDAAQSQLTQYAGKKVVYFEAAPGDEPNDSAGSKLQSQLAGPGNEDQQGMRDQRGNNDGQGQGRRQQAGPTPRSTQDEVMPFGQIQRSNGQQNKAAGRPLGMSSWDTGNEDPFPSQQPRPMPASQSDHGDRDASASQKSGPPPQPQKPTKPKGAPPQPEVPKGNPPPWIQMALAKKKQNGGRVPAAQLPPPPPPPKANQNEWSRDTDDSQQQQPSQTQQSSPPAQQQNSPPKGAPQQRPPPQSQQRTPPRNQRPTFAPIPVTPSPAAPSRDNQRPRPHIPSHDDESHGYMGDDPSDEPPKGLGGRRPPGPLPGRRPNDQSAGGPQPQSYQMPEESNGPGSAKYSRPGSPQSRPNVRPAPSHGQDGQQPSGPSGYGRPRPSPNQDQSGDDGDSQSDHGQEPNRAVRPSMRQKPQGPPSSDADDDSRPPPRPSSAGPPRRQPSPTNGSPSRSRFPGQRGQPSPPSQSNSPWAAGVNTAFPLGSEEDDQQPPRSPASSWNARPSASTFGSDEFGASSLSEPNAQFLFSANGQRNGRPSSSDGRPSSSDGGPSSSDGRPSSSDGGPSSSDGGPSSSDGRPASSDGSFGFPQRPSVQQVNGKLDAFRTASASSFPGRPHVQRQQSSGQFSRPPPKSSDGSDGGSDFATGERSVQDQISQLRHDAFPSFGDMGDQQGGSRQWSGFGDSQQESRDHQVSPSDFSGSQTDSGPSSSDGGEPESSRPTRSMMQRVSGDNHDDDREQQQSPTNFDYQRFYVGI
ncbi:hypothetical protein BV898_11936 [Hypsibius exemplaris]|uniref:Chitin-binding type-2 domain-containing protein n=1 Tax=Hypsibius exemplaris TaxID=2072580 RepID=A0A1W0WF78_HYPEX|nr:hypothetical protein BV898_11936 [Hypsibius exemplaris]